MIRYKSKIGYGILAFIILVFCTTIGLTIGQGSPINDLLSMNVILILGFAFIIYLFLNIEYIIVERKLKIKCGFFYTKALNIDMIKSITRTNSIISAPAASLDRIELLYNDNGKFDSIIISPKDKVNFTKELMKINPNIINKIIE